MAIGSLPEEDQQSVFSPGLEMMCDPNHEWVTLARKLDWQAVEAEFGKLYTSIGRPCIPIRVMVGLLIIQRMKNVSDEQLIIQWVQNAYWQFFCGMTTFQWEIPCDPSELTRFRQRLGENGTLFLLKWSIDQHRQQSTGVKAEQIVVDSTVQDKNVTTPRDHKLYRTVINHLHSIAEENELSLRRTYRRELKSIKLGLRTANHPRSRAAAKRLTKRLRTIAGILYRDVLRQLSNSVIEKNAKKFLVYEDILEQEHGDGNQRIYSVHEPGIYAIGKGKDRIQWEFGTKVSLAIDPKTGVILSAINHPKNIHDSHAVTDVIRSVENNTGTKPFAVVGDLGYRNAAIQAELEKNDCWLITPNQVQKSDRSTPNGRWLRKMLKFRARIEGVIGGLKATCRLSRNDLKGSIGDSMNLMLSALGWNLKKLLRLLCALSQTTAAGSDRVVITLFALFTLATAPNSARRAS